jgi:hypothetical protein
MQSATVMVGNTSYFKLLLDINQTSSHPLLSLDQLQFYTSPTGSQTTTNISSLGTLRYSFSPVDAVYLDASRNRGGSGIGDMFAFIPTSAFAGTPSSDFIYMYCHFGSTYSSNDGFEEWATVVAPVPEASTFFTAIGFVVALFSVHELRRRKLKADDTGAEFFRGKSLVISTLFGAATEVLSAPTFRPEGRFFFISSRALKEKKLLKRRKRLVGIKVVIDVGT